MVISFTYIKFLFQKVDNTIQWINLYPVDSSIYWQRAKKVLSDSPRLVDFAIGLVNSVINLPDGQVMFFDEFE